VSVTEWFNNCGWKPRRRWRLVLTQSLQVKWRTGGQFLVNSVQHYLDYLGENFYVEIMYCVCQKSDTLWYLSFQSC